MQVDYELNTITGNMEIAHRYDKEYFMSNLSMLLQWSPYSTEAELLKQVSSYPISFPLLAIIHCILCCSFISV